jgi:DNA-binding transcriptional regulator YiaG
MSIADKRNPILRFAPYPVNTTGVMSATLADLTERLQARRELPLPEVRRTLRRVAGASQADVAAIVGVTRQAVQLWEAGTRTPRGANLDRYLEVLREFRRVVAGLAEVPTGEDDAA